MKVKVSFWFRKSWFFIAFSRGLFNLVNHSGAMSSSERQGFVLRTVVLLKCLQGSDYFPSKAQSQLSQEELYIGQLLFHFQTGIQYNLHAVYQVIIFLFCHHTCLHSSLIRKTYQIIFPNFSSTMPMNKLFFRYTKKS